MAETARWQDFYTQVDGHIILVRTDVQAAAELEELQAPNLLRVQYVLQAADEHGMPQAAEEALLDELRGELKDWIGALGGRLVGETRGAAQQSWYFYVPCGWLEAANLVHRIGLRKNVTLGAEMMADAGHRIYRDMLLPKPDDLRRTQIANRLADLAASGDDATQPRPVSHEVHFDNRVQAFACAEWARRNGFVVDGLLPPVGADGAYRLTFHRMMTPDAAALDADIALVAETVRQLGGRHTGWQMAACLQRSA